MKDRGTSSQWHRLFSFLDIPQHNFWPVLSSHRHLSPGHSSILTYTSDLCWERLWAWLCCQGGDMEQPHGSSHRYLPISHRNLTSLVYLITEREPQCAVFSLPLLCLCTEPNIICKGKNIGWKTAKSAMPSLSMKRSRSALCVCMDIFRARPWLHASDGTDRNPHRDFPCGFPRVRPCSVRFFSLRVSQGCVCLSWPFWEHFSPQKDIYHGLAEDAAHADRIHSISFACMQAGTAGGVSTARA